MSGVITVMTPDYDTPSGGVTVIYDLVDELVDLGHDAAVWHGTGAAGCARLRPRTRVVTGLSRVVDPGDVLVVPESGGPRHRHLTGDARVVILNQGHHFTFDGVRPDDELVGDYPGWDNAVAAIATSEAIRELLRLATPDGFPVHHVPVHVDAGLFAPATKERRVAVMTRRRPGDVTALVQLLRRGGLLPDGWVVDLVDGRPRSEVASALARAAIFVSTAERDGFGLPGAEAMAAGCCVVGFTGDGGREFLRPDTARVVEDSDVVALTRTVAETMRQWDDDPAGLRAMAGRGRDLVRSRYSRERMRAALAAAVSDLTGDGSPARQPGPSQVVHYQAHAARTDPLSRARTLGRRSARRIVDAVSGARAPRSPG